MEIGLVGSPNTGKSTFFNAATMQNAETGNRPFVTIKANQGTAFVKTSCPHTDLKTECQPQTGYCINGNRFTAVKLWDVAGLVPDAWQGKGLGNKFLSEIMISKALIQVIDVSGQTDVEGNTNPNNKNPEEQVLFLEKEINYWLKGILEKNWDKISKTAGVSKKPEKILAENLSGLGITEKHVKTVLTENNFDNTKNWKDEDLLKFVTELVKKSKPVIYACNKIDLNEAEKNFKQLQKKFPEKQFIECSSESELALKRAHEKGLIKYVSGENDFQNLKQMDKKQEQGLNFIRENVLKKFNGTGVQKILNKTVFELLDMIIVYPVQDANKWVSGKGNVLPDSYLIKKNSNALDLAFKIHSDFGNRFISAVNCKTNQKLGKESALQNNDIVKINLKN